MPGRREQYNDVLVCALTAASLASVAGIPAAVATPNSTTSVCTAPLATPYSATSVCTDSESAATLSTAAFAASVTRTAHASTAAVHTAISSFTLVATVRVPACVGVRGVR